ncbi:A24 family peptidase [Aeromonas finlandensis]|uniref:A24 family peptidase n=1 Tax=Aeromonas finlandensis TaxID=1543375 RepID=UPI0009DF0DFB|nr:prepilin peptidase [Aeromonas finlandensis]
MTNYSSYALAPLFIVLIWICITDITHRTISNYWVTVCIILVLLINILEGRGIHVIPASVLLAVGFILFNLNVIGGGDVKLMTVLALAFDAQGVLLFLHATAIFGGVIALLALCFFRKRSMTQGVAYGVAITAGFITAYHSQFMS